MAQQYAGQAQDIPAGSPRGVLVATSPTLPTASTGTNSVIAFGATELWTVEADAPAGFVAGPAATNERLSLPDIHPAGANGIWVVVEVADVEIAEIFISQGGIQGATGADRRLVLPVSVTADALIRVGFWPRASTVASYIQLTGNSDTLPANTVVKIYTAVVRGAGGGGGGGGASSFSDLTGTIADDQIPDDRVVNRMLADDAVDTDEIDDGAVTTANIAASAVHTGKINDDAVTTDKLADNAVHHDSIVDNAVRPDNIQASCGSQRRRSMTSAVTEAKIAMTTQ